MKITFDSELMQNQKHAVVMAPDVAFEVLQSQQGDALFFSIGTDGVFYVTREAAATTTGWSKIDLSSVIAQQQGGAACRAKSFRVAQNPQSGAIDLALVVTLNGNDALYLSLGNPNTDDSWSGAIAWTPVPFDAGTAPSPFTIADVYILNLGTPGGSGITENIFVDIIGNPANQLQIVSRYYITPGASPQWGLHALPADVAAGSVSSCLGNRAGDPVPGIYTFGTIASVQQLFYTPQFNYFNPNVAPSVARLTLPAGSTAIAAAVNSAGTSNLFVSAAGGIYVFTPANQGDQAVPVLAVDSGEAAGASTLSASTGGGRTCVWGIDPQGNLFYASCAEGSEADATAWSNPVPLVPSAQQFAFYLNNNAGTNTLFASIDGQNLIQLSQDAVTSDWRERSILLPSTDVNDIITFDSFTTHIQITDDNGVGQPGQTAQLTATSPVSAYVNDVYYVLSPNFPVTVTADGAGIITVIQQTQSLLAVCLQLTLTSDASVTAGINPMSKAQATLKTITSGSSLSAVQVPNADGTTQPLIPAAVSSNDVNAAATALGNFSTISASLPQDGSRQPATAATTPGTNWGVSFGTSGLLFHQGVDAEAVLLARKPRADGSIGHDIAVAAGDLFRWLKKAFDAVGSFVVKQVDGLYHFITTIADDVYDAVLDTLDAVAHAVEFVFNKIKVAFKDLVKWLGFIFQWGDILNTHKVLRQVFQLSAEHAVDLVTNLETQIQSAFAGVEQYLSDWAGLPQAGTTGSYQSQSAGTPGYNSPPANWALHHTKSNITSATTHYTMPSDGGTMDQILADLKNLVDQDIDDLKTMVQQIQSDVIEPFATLSAAEVFKRLAVIVTNAILTAAQNLIIALLDLLKILMQSVINLLEAPIEIPILSKIYSDITHGDKLSFLDLTCLVVAIPVTIVYKLAAKQAPFTPAQTATICGLTTYPAFLSYLTAPPARQLLAVAPGTAAATTDPDGSSTLHGFQVLFNFVGVFGGIGMAVIGGLKKVLTDAQAPPPKPLRYLAAGFYFPYVAPDIIGAASSPGAWYTVLNDSITCIDLGKAFADNSDTLSKPGVWADYISPVAESVINLVWLAPAVGLIVAATKSADGAKTSDWLSLAANLSFDLGGILTFATSDTVVPNPVVNLAAFVAAEGLTAAYGLLCAGTAMALLEGH